ATRKPIDAVIGNLNQISQNLILVATNPAQAPTANIVLQNEVAGLRNNAARMPRPFDQLLAQAVAQFEKDVSTTRAGQLMIMLRDQIYPVCQRTITDHYPFVKASKNDVPLADFAKLFSPNGLLDRFFTQNLAPYADTSKQQWAWRQSSGVDPLLSNATLRASQLASEIRDAYFQTGGNLPSVSLAVTPPASSLNVNLEVGGTSVATAAAAAPTGTFGGPPAAPQTSNSPVTVQWPSPSPRTAILVGYDNNSPHAPAFEQTGPSTLFLLLV